MVEYYGLVDAPFSLSPNPRYLYLSDQHRMAISKLRYVIESRQGLAVLYGDIGHGKTTLIRHLYDIYSTGDGYQAVMVTNPHYPSAMQLLKRICDEFHIQRRRSKLDQMEELEGFFIHQYKEGKNIVLIVDEAQLMVGPMFELIRQITNFESHTTKLVQIILSGQNNLRNKLKLKPSLSSRAATYSTLDPLTFHETKEMINYRLMVAGRKDPIFSDDVYASIYEMSKGIPRETVKICMNALTLGAINKKRLIDNDIIQEAIHEQQA